MTTDTVANTSPFMLPSGICWTLALFYQLSIKKLYFFYLLSVLARSRDHDKTWCTGWFIHFWTLQVDIKYLNQIGFVCPIHYFEDKTKGNLMVRKWFYLFSKWPPFFSTTNWHLSDKFKKVEVFIFWTSLRILAFKSSKFFGNRLYTFDLR